MGSKEFERKGVWDGMIVICKEGSIGGREYAKEGVAGWGNIEGKEY